LHVQQNVKKCGECSVKSKDVHKCWENKGFEEGGVTHFIEVTDPKFIWKEREKSP